MRSMIAITLWQHAYAGCDQFETSACISLLDEASDASGLRGQSWNSGERDDMNFTNNTG